jgi:ankyrin repeat protein
MFTSGVESFKDLSKTNLFEIDERIDKKIDGKAYRILYEKMKSPKDRFLHGLGAFILTLTGVGFAFHFVRQRWQSALYGKITHYVDEESLPEIIKKTEACTQEFFTQEIEKAIGTSDGNTLQDLLRFEMNLNCNNAEGLNPLHLAVLSNQPDIVQLLLDRKVNIEARSEEGLTALYLAAMCNNQQIVNLLIQKGADVNAKDTKGCTPLIEVAFADKQGIVELLIQKGVDVNTKDTKGCTAFEVVFAGKQEMVNLLIQKGADVNAKTNKGCTALHNATLADNQEMVNLLIQKGADVNATDTKGYTALHLVASKGNLEMVGCLKSQIAIDTISKNGYSPSMMAYSAGYKELGDTLRGLSSSKTQAFLWHKLINHRFGLNIIIEGVKLFGFSSHITYSHLLKSIQTATEWKTGWNQEDTNEVIKILEFALVLKKTGIDVNEKKKQALKAYNNGDIVIIPTGFYQHANMAVFAQGWMIKGDRARNKDPALYVYEINKTETVETVFQKLIEEASLSKEENKQAAINYYYNEINQDLDLKKIQTIPKSKQHGGVCAWASAKLAFHGALYLYLHKKKGLTPKEALNRSQGMYKAWMREDRFNALKHYIDHVSKNNKYTTSILACLYQRLKKKELSIGYEKKNGCELKKRSVQDLLKLIETTAPEAFEQSKNLQLNTR